MSVPLSIPHAHPAPVRELRTITDRQSEEDAQLVRRALAGDATAEEVLYRRHVKGLTALVTRLLSRSAEAEDAVQDSFVVALSDLKALRDPAAFRPWLYQIGVRQAHRRYRRRRLRRALGLDSGNDDATLAQLVDERVNPELRAEFGKLDGALDALRPADRLSWLLRYVEGYRYTEIARAMGCSEATAKRRVERALGKIRGRLSIDLEEATDD